MRYLLALATVVAAVLLPFLRPDRPGLGIGIGLVGTLLARFWLAHVDSLRERIDALERQVRDLGETPVTQPLPSGQRRAKASDPRVSPAAP